MSLLRELRDDLGPIAISFVILGIFCGYWTVKFLGFNLSYYSQSDSFGNTGFNPLKSLIGLLSRVFVDFRIEYLLLFFAVLIFSLWKQKIFTRGNLVLVWYFLSFLIFWIFIIGLDSMKLGKVYLIGFPIMFFSLALLLVN